MAEYAEKPRWMAEPSLQDIPQEKLDFLQKMVFESRELSQKDLLPFLMALAQRSRSSNITFSTEEMNTIIAAIKKIQHSGRAFKNEPDYEADAAREIALHLPR